MIPFKLLPLLSLPFANAYWLMGVGKLSVERLDPIVNPGQVSGHSHLIMGGSNFGFDVTTDSLRKSQCTSTPIPQDKSAYWVPNLYFQWANGSFSSVDGGGVIYYLFPDQAGKTKAFPDNFRMISGDPSLRTYDANSFAQQAVSFLCLNFNGVSQRYTGLPPVNCPSGVRAQINFPSCWDGKNVDSPDHKSHVKFLDRGPDSGECTDPNFPVRLPRIFIELYWGVNDFANVRSQAKNPSQPFVLAQGDPTGYGHHADFYNGWEAGVLQKAVDNCHCNPYGDPTCCKNAGIFDFNPQGSQCHITPQVNEQVLGTLTKLPGNNPVQSASDAVNGHVVQHPDPNPPQALYPPTAYQGNTPPADACAIGKLGTNCRVGPVPGGSAPAANAAPASANPAGASTAAAKATSAAPAPPASASQPALNLPAAPAPGNNNPPAPNPPAASAPAPKSTASSSPSKAPVGSYSSASGSASYPVPSGHSLSGQPASNHSSNATASHHHHHHHNEEEEEECGVSHNVTQKHANRRRRRYIH